MSGKLSRDIVARGLDLYRAGKLADAEALYRQALEMEPRHATALTMLGTIQAQRGNWAEAARLLEMSLALDPHQPNALYNHGIVLAELKRFEEALAKYDSALALKPDNPVILNNRGNALAELKRFEEALSSYNRAIALKNDYPDAFLNRGMVLSGLRRHGEALDSYDRALAIRPDDAGVLFHRANVLVELRRLSEAAASYDRAIALDPENALAFNNRGNALASLARRFDALESYERALDLKPDYLEALLNRGHTLSELGRHDEALDCYTRAVGLDADGSYAMPYVRGHVACAKLYVCDWSAYEETADRVVEQCLAGEKVLVPFGSYLLRDCAELQYRCARTFVEDTSPASPHPIWRRERYAHERIRLGYISFDFREHMVAYQVASIAEHHDRSRFETTGLSLYPKAVGPMRDRLQSAFEHFVDVSDRGDVEVARLVRDLEIDILVDLTGHTRGGRVGIFAHRPAPVQVNFNCPGTSGADYLDYIIADRIVVPPEHHRYCSEKVVYLPDTFQPNDSRRGVSAHTPSRDEAGLPEDGFVFCSFNSSYKIRPRTFDVWMRLLRAFDGSVLWLLGANARVVGNLQREARARGVDPGRLIFAPRVQRLEDHLARQRNADLFLDTLPYNAQTTAVDALWAGLPVLTCLGGAFSGRVAASALTAIGLPELITASLEEYEALAASLAREPDRLRQIRDKLARNRHTRPLFDIARFTRHLEAAYEEMSRVHRQGEAPRHFSVMPQDGVPHAAGH